jgi:hypothetical protein
MLYEVSRDVGTALRAKGCPFGVVYRQRLARVVGVLENVVELAPDEQPGTVGPPKAVGGNPARRFTWFVPGSAGVHAVAKVAGARAQDHERQADRAVESLLVALDDVLRGGRRLLWTVRGITPVELEDAADSETPLGVVREVRFEIQRGVFAVKWDGSGASVSAPLAGVRSRTTISGAGGGTACGG